MYHNNNVSPIRQGRAANNQPNMQRVQPDRSRSPLPSRAAYNVSPSPQSTIPNINIIGSMNAPPGMQTILKPKIFEAIEVPSNQMPTMRQASQVQVTSQVHVIPQYQSTQPQYVQQLQDPEHLKRIASLEHQLNQARVKIMQLEAIARSSPDKDNINQKFSEKIREIEQLNEEKNYLIEQMRQLTSTKTQELFSMQHKSISENDHHVKLIKNELDEQKRVLTQQCESYYKQYQQAEQDKSELQYKVRQLESQGVKLQNLQHQLQDQSERDVHMGNEIKIWKQKYSQVEEDRIRQIESLRDEYERIYNQQYEGLKQNFENKCRMLEDEMERTRDQLNESTREAETWRSKYHQEDLEKLSYTQKISQLELQNLHQQKDIDRISLINQQKIQEVESLRSRINQLEYNHVQILQPSLETELKRLREQMESRNRELEDLRKRNHEIEQYCVKMKEVEVEYDILQHKFHELERGQTDLSKYKHLYEQMHHEYEDMKNKSIKQDAALQDQKRSEYRLQQELQRINDLLRLKDDEMNRQVADNKRNMQQLQNQMQQLKEQYERELSGQSNAKNRSEQEFRDNLERKFSIMKEELENQRREREQLLQTCSQLSQTKIHLENKIVSLTGEIERLNQVIRAKYEEHQNLKENYRLLNEQLEQSQSQVQELRGDNYRSRGQDSNYKNSVPKQFEPRTYENSHKGSQAKPYDTSQLPSQKHFDIPSHQQDFSN